MSMTLAQLWQIVADAKNDLHVVEQELAKLVDEEEKREDKSPVYENFLPVGTYLLSEEEHRMAPIGTLISEKDIRNGKVASLVWKKVDLNHWCVARPGFYAPCTDATICDRGSYYVNVVVEQDKDKTPVDENSLPAGTALVTHEDHEKAPIGTLIRELDANTGEFGVWSWRKVGPKHWVEYDPSGLTRMTLTTAQVTQVLPHIVNTVVDS